MTVAVILLLSVLVLIAVLGYFLAGFSMQIKRQTLDQARVWQEEHYDLSWYDLLKKEDYTVRAEDGYELHAEFLHNPHPTDRMMILSHGYTDNRFGSLKYARMYLDEGFHVLVYDLRGHGENEPTFCTYSIREQKDLNTLIRDTRRRYPEMKTLGIHGESLGSATSIACLKEKPEIDFVVADCGFSEIESVMRSGLRGMHLPGFMVHVASLFAKVRYGYFYHEMRPIDSLLENRIPILFIHGDRDDFIPPLHSERMQQATMGESELHLIAGAGHAASVLTAPEAYQSIVHAFVRKTLGS